MSWDKEHVMKKLEEKVQTDAVDLQILPIIELINSHPDYYTTSSCSGRIQIIELPQIGDKKKSIALGKWHEPVTHNQVQSVLNKWNGTGVVYLLAQSPIIHVVCKSLGSASELRNIADSAGFKYSSIRSLKEQKAISNDDEFEKITVEILSTERVDVPVAAENKIFPDDEYLEFIINNANNCLVRAQRKLKILRDKLKIGLTD
jgi:tRNA wybutosine-synthesizing protein 3